MSTPLLFSRNNMSKPKYDFTKEELQCVYNREKTFSKAAKVLGVSKTTFRQQYLKSQNKCIVCASENDSLTNSTCTKCQRPKELHPDTKFCSRCSSQIKRDKSKSKLAWNKTHVCQSCKDKTNKKCIRQAYVRVRPKKLHKQRTSKEYKDYQKEYRQSEHGKLRRKISNIKRKCAKITTCSDGINDYIEKLFNNPDKKCIVSQPINYQSNTRHLFQKVVLIQKRMLI